MNKSNLLIIIMLVTAIYTIHTMNFDLTSWEFWVIVICTSLVPHTCTYILQTLVCKHENWSQFKGWHPGCAIGADIYQCSLCKVLKPVQPGKEPNQ